MLRVISGVLIAIKWSGLGTLGWNTIIWFTVFSALVCIIAELFNKYVK